MESYQQSVDKQVMEKSCRMCGLDVDKNQICYEPNLLKRWRDEEVKIDDLVSMLKIAARSNET